MPAPGGSIQPDMKEVELRTGLLSTAAVVLFAAAALAGGGRLLPFAPLEDAKAGDGAKYKLEILDAGGRVVSTSEKRWDVDAHEDGIVKVGKVELSDQADAAEIIGALRLLPPGTPLDGLTVKTEKVAVPKSKDKADGVHASLRAKLQGGATEVVFDAWFVKGIPPFALVRARTKIVGGGAGESAYEIVDWRKP